MRNNSICFRSGFTLIEVLVVLGVMVLIVVSIGGIMLGVFNSQNKNERIDEVNRSGMWILNELKKNVLNARSDGDNGLDNSSFSCLMDGGTSMVVTNVKDNEKTILSCLGDDVSGYKIASISAVGTTVYLFQKSSDLVLNGCNNFVTCSTLPSLQLSEVKFSFNLRAGIPGLSNEISKDFSIDVTLRN